MAFDWTDDTDRILATLWADGVPTKAIGAAMGINKNQVIGRAHRLRLPSRLDPIKRAERKTAKIKPAAQEVAAITRPSLVSVTMPAAIPFRIIRAAPAAPRQTRHWVPGERLAPIPPTTPPQPEPSADRLAGVVFKPRARGACCWPMWGMERPTHQYCDAPADAGRSYCQQHMRVAYARVAA